MKMSILSVLLLQMLLKGERKMVRQLLEVNDCPLPMVLRLNACMGGHTFEIYFVIRMRMVFAKTQRNEELCQGKKGLECPIIIYE